MIKFTLNLPRLHCNFNQNRYFHFLPLHAHRNNFSPTKASGGMFSNVTGKVSGWLPSSMPTVSMPSVSMPAMPQVSLPAMPAMPSIPGLRKTQPTGEEGAEVAAETAVEAQPAPVEKDDDDRSR